MSSGHFESMKPADANFNNRLWNGYGDPRVKPVLPEPPVNWPLGWRRNTLKITRRLALQSAKHSRRLSDPTNYYVGKSLPVVVTVNLPCLTPFAAISSSAIFLMRSALPRTTSTSRQLW